jgi:hypothetical protein
MSKRKSFRRLNKLSKKNRKKYSKKNRKKYSNKKLKIKKKYGGSKRGLTRWEDIINLRTAGVGGESSRISGPETPGSKMSMFEKWNHKKAAEQARLFNSNPRAYREQQAKDVDAALEKEAAKLPIMGRNHKGAPIKQLTSEELLASYQDYANRHIGLYKGSNLNPPPASAVYQFADFNNTFVNNNPEQYNDPHLVIRNPIMASTASSLEVPMQSENQKFNTASTQLLSGKTPQTLAPMHTTVSIPN